MSQKSRESSLQRPNKLFESAAGTVGAKRVSRWRTNQQQLESYLSEYETMQLDDTLPAQTA